MLLNVSKYSANGHQIKSLHFLLINVMLHACQLSCILDIELSSISLHIHMVFWKKSMHITKLPLIFHSMKDTHKQCLYNKYIWLIFRVYVLYILRCLFYFLLMIVSTIFIYHNRINSNFMVNE